MSEEQDYLLGYSAQEAKRLADQGAQLEELTEDVLRRAGLRRGMQVLDIGLISTIKREIYRPSEPFPMNHPSWLYSTQTYGRSV